MRSADDDLAILCNRRRSLQEKTNNTNLISYSTKTSSTKSTEETSAPSWSKEAISKQNSVLLHSGTETMYGKTI